MPLDPLPITATRCPCSRNQHLALYRIKSTYRVVVFLIPGGTVQQLPLEIMKTRNVGPLPVVQGTGRLNQDITVVPVHGAAIDIEDLRAMGSALSQFDS